MFMYIYLYIFTLRLSTFFWRKGRSFEFFSIKATKAITPAVKEKSLDFVANF